MESFIFKGEKGVSLRGRLAIIGGFGFLLVAAVAAVVLAVLANNAEHWATHSDQVQRGRVELMSAVQDAEIGQRGYLLTGDPSYLKTYETALVEVPRLSARLRALVADSPVQQARAAGIAQTAKDRIDVLRQAVDLQKQGRADAALAVIKTHVGRDLMNKLRAQADRFAGTEQALLVERRERASLSRTVLVVVIVLALLTSALLAILVSAASRRQAAQILSQNKALVQERDGREAAEDMLRQAQKMEALGQLTGGIAHDFNNMLAIIVGSLDMMMRRLQGGDEKLRTLAENALSGANRASSLTKRLLAFSRLQPLDPKPVEINKCVSGMAEMLRRSLGEQIAVEAVLGGGTWPAFVDQAQLESALLNLAVNARDAMDRGGKLTVETSNAFLDQNYAEQHVEVEPGQYVLIAVTDTGSGMTPEVLAKAFDPFYTTKGVGAGTGLGLSQVHGFVKQSRGHIKLYSEVGVGTTVKIYLPRDTSGGAAAVDTKRAPIPATDRSRHVVLIVEDDPGVRAFVVSATRELGFSVIEADGAAMALQELDEHPEIEIILTDVVMPGTNGRQLVDAAIAKRPDLQIIFMTGYTRNAIVHNGMLDAGTRLLTKPFTLNELERELASLLPE